LEKAKPKIGWSTRYARRVSPWPKLEASNIALTAVTRNRLIRLVVPTQASTIAANAKTSAGKSEEISERK